ncbi:MAG TPA: GAF domain-containing protein [Flavisolibacter sp.]|nr:GAF domain-containing protein [Flavisolibacter sp.]
MENTFGINIIPDNEENRLQALYRYNVLHELPKRHFTNLARIIATTFNVPIALISLVDKETVHFPGNYGMQGTKLVARGISLCSLAVLDEKPTVFENALQEPCLLANPLVSGKFGLRFYAGAPIRTDDGYAIGTVCIVDKEPRTFARSEQELLEDFAQTVMQELEMRRKMLLS